MEKSRNVEESFTNSCRSGSYADDFQNLISSCPKNIHISSKIFVKIRFYWQFTGTAA